MRDIILTLDRFGDQALLLGRVGENRATRVSIDLKSILSQYPDAIASITVKQPGRAEYPAAVKQEGGILTWEITSADIGDKAGSGQAQITIQDADGTIIKTAIATTRVTESLGSPNTPAPDPVKGWVANAEEILADVERSGTAAQTIADEVKRKLDAGELKGEPGRDGIDGKPGKDGAAGATGATPQIKAEAVTGEPGTQVSVTQSGTPENPTLSFKIPRGEPGRDGAPGEPGKDAPQEAVLYIEQTLSEAQKTQARENVGAASTGELNQLKEDLDDSNNKLFYVESKKDKVNLIPLSTEIAKNIYSAEYTTLTDATNSTVCIYDNLTEGDTLLVSSTVMNTGKVWGFSFTDDRNKTIYHHIDDALHSLSDKTDIEIIVPIGAKKLYVSRLTSKGEPKVYKEVKSTIKIPKFVNDVLYGKKMIVFGDSMAYGHTIPDKVWVKLLAEKYNMNLTNKAQNGTTIVRKTTTMGDSKFLDTDSIYAKVMDNLNNPVDADYVIVFGGTNDIARNDQCPLGTIDDATSQTFYGALNAICQRLIQTYPSENICFITPYIRNDGLANTEVCKQYINAIHDVCEKWGGIPVFDNSVNGGVDFSHSDQIKTLTMQDSYHLNEAGHLRAMHKYEVFLQSL